MIAGSSIPRKIGEVYEGIRDVKLDYHPNQRFVILREATMEEWIEWQKDNGFDFSKLDSTQKLKIALGYFYEISTD